MRSRSVKQPDVSAHQRPAPAGVRPRPDANGCPAAGVGPGARLAAFRRLPGALAAASSVPGAPVLWLALLALVLTCLLVNPWRETPLEDDWAYALTVRHVLETGTYQANDWMSANMPFQAYWGALFTWPFGLSHAALRVSTLVLVFFGLIAFYSLAREHGLPTNRAGLLTLALWCSPLVVRFSFNFMTDVPYLMWLMIALALYTRALRRRSYPWMLAGALAACAAVLTRQFGVALVCGLAVLWLLDRARWRKVPLYLSGIALPLAAGAWQFAQGLSAPTWAMAKTGRSQLLYMQSWPLLADMPWRVTLVLQYLALFCLPLVVLALADLAVAWRRRGALPRPAWPALLGLGLAGVMAWWRWIGGQPNVEAGPLVWVVAVGLGLSAVLALLPRRRGEPAGKGLDPLPAGLALLTVGSILYGMDVGSANLTRFMGATDVPTSWAMPYLPWNFEDLQALTNGVPLVVTVLTSAGAVLFACWIVARYRKGTATLPTPPSRRLLDLVTLFLLLQTLVFCHLGDEYLLAFLPFGLIVLGHGLGDRLDRRLGWAVAACAACLLVSALWTRGILAEAEAYWQGAETARQTTGLPPEEIYGYWTWNCFHGAFQTYLAETNAAPQDTFEDFFRRWRGAQRARAAVVVEPLEGNVGPGQELLAEFHYPDALFRVKKMGVIKVRQ